ncbi:MAG: DUF2892 domain-containing protein [Alphaproteobacteria bacterium]|nr:DUF2892 domain-containing protein [Alphaproteobacteria bacterium]
MNAISGFNALTPAAAKAKLDSGEAVLIDIRETDEWRRERIPGARHLPLSAWDSADTGADAQRAAIFICRSGNRTAVNAERLLSKGLREAFHVEGGILAWREAGLPLAIDKRRPIEIMRQVQIVAGSLVAIGTLLAALVSPYWLLLSGGVGAGLVFAGASGSCMMATLLSRMPWNRRA